MFELSYDILDELDAREVDAAKAVVEQTDDEQVTPEEFYPKLQELFCTHLFIVNLTYTYEMDVEELCYRMQQVTENYFGACGLNVQAVTVAFGKPYITMPDSHIRELPYNTIPEQYGITFKIPVRMIPALTKEEKPRLVSNTVNFLASLYSIIKKFQTKYNERGCIYSYRVNQKMISESILSKYEPVHTEDFYRCKFQPETYIEQDDTSSERLFSMAIELYNILVKYKESTPTNRTSFDKIKAVLQSWIERYKHTDKKLTFVESNENKENDEFSTKQVEVNGRHYTIIT